MPRESVRDLRRRISSVETVVSVTAAMKTVASIKLRRARSSLAPAREYHAAIRRVWSAADPMARQEALHSNERSLLGTVPEFLEKVGSALPLGSLKQVYVVISADRGLAGAFSADVVRAALRAGAAEEGHGIIAIGSRGNDILRARGLKTLELALDDVPAISFARYLALGLASLWNTHRASSLLVYTRFVSVLRREVTVEPCLPPSERGEATPKQEAEPGTLWEPSEAEVAKEVLSRYLASSIYLSLIESRTSEMAARVTSMDSATEKAEDLLEELRQKYNRLRRERITGELIEVTAKEPHHG